MKLLLIFLSLLLIGCDGGKTPVPPAPPPLPAALTNQYPEIMELAMQQILQVRPDVVKPPVWSVLVHPIQCVGVSGLSGFFATEAGVFPEQEMLALESVTSVVDGKPCVGGIVNLHGAWPEVHVVDRAEVEKLIEHEMLHVIAHYNWPEETCPNDTQQYVYWWVDHRGPCNLLGEK